MPASGFRARLGSIFLVFTAALVATPASAGPDDNVLANQTGDDPTQPLGKIELLDRFTTTPGPGAPDIRWNYGTPVYGQTGRFFLPLNFMVGWKPTPHTIVSAEFGIPIIKDFPAYTFKTQLRVGYLF